MQVFCCLRRHLKSHYMPSLRAGFISEAISFYEVTHCEEIASAKRRLAMTRQTGFSNTLLGSLSYKTCNTEPQSKPGKHGVKTQS